MNMTSWATGYAAGTATSASYSSGCTTVTEGDITIIGYTVVFALAACVIGCAVLGYLMWKDRR